MFTTQRLTFRSAGNFVTRVTTYLHCAEPGCAVVSDGTGNSTAFMGALGNSSNFLLVYIVVLASLSNYTINGSAIILAGLP